MKNNKGRPKKSSGQKLKEVMEVLPSEVTIKVLQKTIRFYNKDREFIRSIYIGTDGEIYKSVR